MRVALVLGSRLLPTGQMSRRFYLRMDRGISLLARGMVDVLIITGGITRLGFSAEAEEAFLYVPVGLRAKTLIENRSRSTSENVRFVKKLLDGNVIDELTVIASRAHVPRTRFLIRRFWPEIRTKTRFEGIGRLSNRERVREFLLYCLAVIDPSNRVLVPLLKKWFRSD